MVLRCKYVLPERIIRNEADIIKSLRKFPHVPGTQEMLVTKKDVVTSSFV